MGVILLKMLKQGTAKVRLMPRIVEKAKIRHGWGLILDENAEISTA